MYYFLEDVFPNEQHGRRLLKTPRLLVWLFDDPPLPSVPEEERAGGFNWGGGAEGVGNQIGNENENGNANEHR